MGEVCIMVEQKMCFGILESRLMARIGSEAYSQYLAHPNASEINFTSRQMKSFLSIDVEGLYSDLQLEFWLKLCLDHNLISPLRAKKNLI